jgi:hypothetical protein
MQSFLSSAADGNSAGALIGKDYDHYNVLGPRHASIARACNDHFSGKLGVGLADALCTCGHLALAEEGGEVMESGVGFLEEFGIDLGHARSRRRIFCRPRLDWTERLPHFGGSVGPALARRCFDRRLDAGSATRSG